MDLEVSVIVPVHAHMGALAGCLAGLARQTVPAAKVQILIVDNGGNPGIADAVARLPNARLLREASPGSYAARNRALPEAQAPVLAFTDADCEPEPDWLRQGLAAFDDPGVDLAGGKVVFRLSDPPTGAERLDAVTNMQIGRDIRERRVAKTANLFVRRPVADAIGPFPAHLRSGGDVQWTAAATAAGFRLVYAPKARVAHPARRLPALVAKQARVGRGQVGVWLSQGQTRAQVLRRTLREAGPFRPGVLRALLAEREGEARHIARVWAASACTRAATAAGRVAGLLSSRRP